MTKFAHADSNMKPLGDWPASKGRNLYNLGMYWTRIAARRRFFA